MTPTEDERRAELALLDAQLRHHERAYRSGEPEIPDAAFDDLVDRYEALADELGVPGSARFTAKPGAEHTDGFETVRHELPMLSLEKLSPGRVDETGASIPMLAQLEAWIARRRKELELLPREPLVLFVEPKIDGISVSLRYEDGVLVRALTRGDGESGDVITAQVRATGAVPDRLAHARGRLELRGELYLPREAFDAHNARLRERGEKTLVNPRNGCAGLMKRKDPSGLREVGVRAFLYQVALADGVALPRTQGGRIAWIDAEGGPTYRTLTRTFADAAEAVRYCDDFAAQRETLPYDIDGMVLKIDDLDLADRLGATGHHPHWGVAYKFPPERKPTRLRGITVQVGKSGKLTPVAELEPVFVSGTTVSRATLHNFPELARKDVRVGDLVLVEKAGEIIPQVVEVVRDARPPGAAPYAAPDACPVCASPVVREEVFVLCPNPACPAQLRERLVHFASRSAMDVDGLGESLVERLVTDLGVTAPDGLYRLDRSALEALPRFGKKSAENLLRGLETSKQRGLARLLTALAVPQLGEATSELIANRFGDLDALLAFARRYVADDAEARAIIDGTGSEPPIEGVARKSADVIFGTLVSPAMVRVLEGLAAAGVSTKASSVPVRLVPGVAGKTFVLTGTLPTLARADAAARIKAAGGKVSSSVSKKTHFVVVGADAGSKLEEAQKLGVPILDEAALLAMLG